MKSIQEAFEEGILVFDGAMGTMLIAAGLSADDGPPERWVTKRPEVIRGIHVKYIDAGADVVITCTFGATRDNLEMYGMGSETAEINRAAAVLAKEAAAGRAYVAGDMGPSGKMLKPYGDAEPDDVRASFAEQAAALARGGVDLILVETMFDPAEARLAVEAAVATGLPVAATMTFSKGPKGFFTIMGTSPQDAAAMLIDAGAFAVGANCTLTIEDFSDLAGILVEAAGGRPVIVEPNAGQPEDEGGQIRYQGAGTAFEQGLPGLLSGGVRGVGGCCGTSPDDVRIIRRAVDAFMAG